MSPTDNTTHPTQVRIIELGPGMVPVSPDDRADARICAVAATLMPGAVLIAAGGVLIAGGRPSTGKTCAWRSIAAASGGRGGEAA
jgi:hypothetical protein